MNRPPIYMLDTNILVTWAKVILGEETKTAATKIQVFCESNPHRVVVPDIVWVEFF